MSSLLPDHDEHLTDGWEPDLDPADSLIRQAVMVHASWATATARAFGRPVADGPGWAAGFVSEGAAMGNWAVPKRPAADLGAVVEEICRFFPPVAPFLFVSPWPTGDLRAYGLSLVGHPPLMIRLPGDAAAATDCELRWVTDGEALADAERVLVDGYPIAELQPYRRGSLYQPAILGTRTRIAVAYDGDRPVATAAAHSACGVTLVEGVATMPAARGKGAGFAVTAAATTAFGEPAVLLASDDGQPVYERLGFLRIERWTAWLRPGS